MRALLRLGDDSRPVPAEIGGTGLSDTELDALLAWPGGIERQDWLRANMVSTADGAARAPDGLSEGISGSADKRIFGRLRGYADVVLVGAGTVRAEGYRPPQPKAWASAGRAAAGQGPVPAIAMVSRSLDLDLDAPVFTEPIVPTIVLTCASADATALAAAQEVADVAVVGDEDVDLQTALEALHQRGLRRVHCEGGPHLLAQLVADDLLDELLLTISPLLVGGSAQVPLLRILSGTELPDPPRRLTLQHVLEDDGTLFLRYRRA